MADIAQKARALRLERLQVMVTRHLEHAAAAIETLILELAAGEPRTSDWEALHAAAVRDRKTEALGTAYQRITSLRRWKELSDEDQARVLMHGADYFQGVLGAPDVAEGFLRRVVECVPDHADAFTRLQSRYEGAGDKLQLAELYSLVVRRPPIAVDEVARKALNAIKLLPAGASLSEDACNRLVGLGPVCLPIVDALDAHCRRTDRFELAARVREWALETAGLSKVAIEEQRQALAELYTGPVKNPEKAISYVEQLLSAEPTNLAARTAAERLLSSRPVASRAAAALKEARRQGGSIRPRSREPQ